MDWPPTDREMLIRIDANVQHLKDNHETYAKKVDDMDKASRDFVTKTGLAGWFTVAFLGLAGLGEMLGVYRKG